MNKEFRCGFCGEVYQAGGDVLMLRSKEDPELLICQICVDTCSTAIQQTIQNYNKDTFNEELLLKPSLMKKYFDNYIINQEKAKKILSVAVYNHYKRTFYNENVATDMKLKKSNVLMVGPSGSGKTLFVETMAKKMGVPYAIADATSLTQSGYVGDDVETVLKKLIENANGDIKAAEKGIVFLDEIDKIGRKGENVSITRDVSGEGVQQALLKMLEGSIISVPISGNRKHPSQECYQIDTSNILFICGGAFEGIEKIVQKRTSKKSKIGLTQNQEESKEMSFNDLINEVTSKDLKKFGMMPEILGRLPIICPLEELDRDALVNILTEPVDSITKQYKTLFEMDGIELHFERECLEAIADKAIKFGTGARALRSVMEAFMTEYMFSIPDMNISKITLTKECVEQKGEPQFEFVDTAN